MSRRACDFEIFPATNVDSCVAQTPNAVTPVQVQAYVLFDMHQVLKLSVKNNTLYRTLLATEVAFLDLQTDGRFTVLTGLVPEPASQVEEAREGHGQGEFRLHPR
jgi:hypothetical protein